MASPSDVRTGIRQAFAEAAVTLVDTVARAPSTSWTLPGLGEWSVRDLVGHASRSFITVETYLDNPATSVDVADPVAYYGIVMASYGNASDIDARGRAAGEALGDDPAAAVAEMSGRVLALVAGRSDDDLLTCPAGG